MNIYEKLFEKNKLNKVVSSTVNISNRGKAKIELVPSKYRFLKTIPTAVMVNNKKIVPLNPSWTILLYSFLEESKIFKGREIIDVELDNTINIAIRKTKKVYHFVSKKTLKKDLNNIINLIFDIVNDKENNKIEEFNVNNFVMNMRAPYCVKLCIRKNESGEELSTNKIKIIIDICRKNCIPKIEFAGEEPTLREDLIEILEYAENMTTSLITNGDNLTKEYCDRLYNAKLDNLDIINVSNEKAIKNAISSNLNVNVYTLGYKENRSEDTFLSSFTIFSNGDVIACNKKLGNILENNFNKIWNCDEALMLKYSSMKGGNKNEK